MIVKTHACHVQTAHSSSSSSWSPSSSEGSEQPSRAERLPLDVVFACLAGREEEVFLLEAGAQEEDLGSSAETDTERCFVVADAEAESSGSITWQSVWIGRVIYS